MFIDRGGDDTWGKDGHINLGHTLRSLALTHSQYLQDLIRVSRCNKVPTWPTETKGFTTRSMQPLVMSAASSSSISSCFSSIFHLLFLLHYNCCSSSLSHCAPFYFNLSRPNLAFSHSLYKYLSLSLSVPPFPAYIWRVIPCGRAHPLKVRSDAAAGADRSGFPLSYKTNWRHPSRVHSINSPFCQWQTHVFAE